MHTYIIYIYIYIYTYIYTHTHLSLSIYIYIYIYTYGNQCVLAFLSCSVLNVSTKPPGGRAKQYIYIYIYTQRKKHTNISDRQLISHTHVNHIANNTLPTTGG